jgi:hypothetical protein
MARVQSLVKLTPQLINAIAGMLFDGFSDDDIAFFHGLSTATISRLRLGTECQAVRRGVISRKQLMIAKIRDGRMKGWQRIAWFLERRYPKEFARADIQLTLGMGSITNNTLVVTAEVGAELAKRAKESNKEIDALLAAKRPGTDKVHENEPEGG